MLREASRLKLRVALALTAAAIVTAPIGAANGQAAAPFSGLSGRWSGAGSIALKDGTTERVRCDESDVVTQGGANLDMGLRCTSDKYNFDLRISLVDTAGQILGNWNEVTKGVEGGISGTSASGLIRVSVRGQNFSAEATIATRGAQQSVAIRSPNSEIGRVDITLHRAR